MIELEREGSYSSGKVSICTLSCRCGDCAEERREKCEGGQRGMARGRARGTCAPMKESSARRVSTPVVVPPGSSMSSTPVAVYLGGHKAVESATWRGHTSAVAASAAHPSGEGLSGPLGSPKQAGKPGAVDGRMGCWEQRAH